MSFLLSCVVTLISLLALCGVLHALPRLGRGGRVASDWVCRAPSFASMPRYRDRD